MNCETSLQFCDVLRVKRRRLVSLVTNVLRQGGLDEVVQAVLQQIPISGRGDARKGPAWEVRGPARRGVAPLRSFTKNGIWGG